MSGHSVLRLFLLVAVSGLLSGCNSSEKDERQVYAAQLHAGPVKSVDFTPDGNTLISSSDDHLVLLLDAEGLKDIEGSSAIDTQLFFQLNYSPLVSTGGGFDCVAISPDGTELAVCDYDEFVGAYIRRFDLTDKASETGMIPTSFWGTRKIAYSPDGMLLAAANGQQDGLGEVRLFSTKDGSQTACFHDIFGGVYDVAFSEDGRSVLSASLYDDLQMFGTDGEPRATFDFRTHHPLSAAFVPDSDLVVSTGEDDFTVTSAYRGALHIWSRDGERLHSLQLSKLPMTSLAVAPNGSAVAVAGEDMLIRVVRLDSFEVSAEIKGHTARINDLAFTPDGRFLASAGSDNYVYVWNVSDLTVPIEIFPDAGTDTDTDLDADGGFLEDGGSEK